MDCLARIRDLLDERGWTMYQLSRSAEIPQSTLSNLFARSNAPSISTLEKICGALNISLSEFFCEREERIMSNEEELLSLWRGLPSSSQQALLELIRTMHNKK